MVNEDPSKRPTIDELRDDPWIQMPNDIEKLKNKLAIEENLIKNEAKIC